MAQRSESPGRSGLVSVRRFLNYTTDFCVFSNSIEATTRAHQAVSLGRLFADVTEVHTDGTELHLASF